MGFCQKVSAGSSNLHSRCPQERTEEKKSLKRNFLNHFRTLTEKNFGLWKNTLRHGFQKWFLRVRGTLSGIFWRIRKCNLSPYPEFDQKTFVLSVEVSSRFIKNAFNVSKRMFWGLFFRKSSFFFFIFALSAKNLTSFWRKVLERTVKTAFYAHRGKIRWFFLRKKNFSSMSDFFCMNFSMFLRNFFGKLVKSAIWVSRGTFWGQNNFFLFSSKKIELSSGKFWLGFQKGIPRVHGNVSRNLLSGQKKTTPFLVFRFWAKTFWIFDETISLSWPKLQSGCPG